VRLYALVLTAEIVRGPDHELVARCRLTAREQRSEYEAKRRDVFHVRSSQQSPCQPKKGRAVKDFNEPSGGLCGPQFAGVTYAHSAVSVVSKAVGSPPYSSRPVPRWRARLPRFDVENCDRGPASASGAHAAIERRAVLTLVGSPTRRAGRSS
jgi:hypothetical protein